MWARLGVRGMCVKLMICYCEDNTFVVARLRKTREAWNGQPKKLRCKASSQVTVRVVQLQIGLKEARWRTCQPLAEMLSLLGSVPAGTSLPVSTTKKAFAERDSCRTCQVVLCFRRWFAKRAATR